MSDRMNTENRVRLMLGSQIVEIMALQERLEASQAEILAKDQEIEKLKKADKPRK